jgi:tryptophan synthase alpha subunit
VVGSRMVQEMENSNADNLHANIQKLVETLRVAIDSAT